MKVITPQLTVTIDCRDGKLLNLSKHNNQLQIDLINPDVGSASVALSDKEIKQVTTHITDKYLSGKRIEQSIKSLSFTDEKDVLTFRYDNYGDPYEEGLLIILERMSEREYEVLESNYCFISSYSIESLHSSILKICS